VKKAAEKKAKEQTKLEAEGGGQSLEPLEAPAPVEDDAPKVEHNRLRHNLKSPLI